MKAYNRFPIEKEKLILEKYSLLESKRAVAKDLGISKTTVKNVLERYNIQANTTSEILLKRYNTEELIVKRIEKVNTKSKLLKENAKLRAEKALKVELKKKERKENLESRFDLNYFQSIDSRDKAYFLGLLIADGYINESRVSISLQSEDKGILETFRKYTQCKKSLHFYKSNNCKHKDQYCLSLNSTKLITQLKPFGMFPNKTHYAYFPNIEEKYWSHFIRGVFDGDGCVHLDNYKNISFNICGNIELISKIQDILMKECVLSKTKFATNKKVASNIVQIKYKGAKQVHRIFEYLYKDKEDLFLDRKFLKFKDYYANREICKTYSD